MSEVYRAARPEIPEKWEWVKLGEIVATTSRGTPSRKRPEYYEGGTIPWLKIGDLDDGVIFETEESITEEAIASSTAKLLPVGTLLLAMYGSIGKLGILGVEATTNQAICALHAKDTALRDYLYWYLKSQRQQLLNAGFGGTQTNISQTFLSTFPVPLPPRNEQERIVSKLLQGTDAASALRTDLTQLERNLARYEASLFSRAFAGGLGTASADDEPAGLLVTALKQEASPPRTRRKRRTRVSS